MFKIITVLLAFGITPAAASALVIPDLHLPPHSAAPRVALTFDACSGKVDERILTMLVESHVKSTIFVTGRWLKRNPAAIKILSAHPDLFEIENHGARHVVAVDKPLRLFGVASAGSPAALHDEIKGGADAVHAAFGRWPTWFRGATASYTRSSTAAIEAMGYRIAGFNRLGDGGAVYSAGRTLKSFSEAQDGDVIIAHINQPAKSAGAGIVQGIKALKARGFQFVTLNESFGPVPRGKR